MKWQDISPPSVSISHSNIERLPAINLNLILSKESTPMKDVGTTVDKPTVPVFMLSNQMKCQDVTPCPLFLFPVTILECPAINLNLDLSKESIPAKDVDTTVAMTRVPVQC